MNISRFTDRHGHAKRGRKSPTYLVWENMRRRCNSPTAANYVNYGGRGIRVCEQWSSFKGFLADMGERPDGLTLDRVDNDGNYEPGNCRWVTKFTQGQNRRTSRIVEYQGRTQNLKQWCKELGLRYSLTFCRIAYQNWPIDRAFQKTERNTDHTAYPWLTPALTENTAC